MNKLIKPIIVQHHYTLVMPLPCVAWPAFASIVHEIVVAVVVVHVAGERVRFAVIGVATFTALQRRTVQGLFLDCGQAVTRIRARFPVSKSSSVVPAASIVDRPPSRIGIIEEAEFVEGEEGE